MLLWVKKGKVGDLPNFDLFRLASLTGVSESLMCKHFPAEQMERW